MAKAQLKTVADPAQPYPLDLTEMDRPALERLSANVERALKTVDARRRAEAKRAAEAAAKEYGFSLNDLGSGQSGSGGKTVLPARYANPDDPSQTWTGRGRKPKWMAEYLEQGGDKEDLAIA